MKKITLYIIYSLFAFISISIYAQNEYKKVKGYRIDGDELVFTFDKRDYDRVTSDTHGSIHDFQDLDIKNVVVSGKFNNWSKKQWRMTKIDDNIYELRKNIQDFSDELSWEFKFVVNNNYWAEPSKKDLNITRAKKNGHSLNVYNLKMYTVAYPDNQGNMTFNLPGHTEADKVILSGSFNKWNEHIYEMNKTEDGWVLTLQIKPGEYQYKFIVDGEWMEDPINPNKTLNEYQGYNSIINIKKQINFVLNGYLNADKVILSGSFNNWSENDYIMEKTTNGWKYTILLSAGKHHYKFIVNDAWVLDPSNSVIEYDYNGNINSVCMVK
ncbi:hypothetical protein [uncultured Aquimarina sp.]|uniref:hypothetical protein n=1 Tax=uncultured Aquimarina sp. TaxID=575652 RepID=UPI00261E7578|nr:hypothetical protein [uncultured Aquimarina sp.]